MMTIFIYLIIFNSVDSEAVISFWQTSPGTFARIEHGAAGAAHQDLHHGVGQESLGHHQQSNIVRPFVQLTAATAPLTTSPILISNNQLMNQFLLPQHKPTIRNIREGLEKYKNNLIEF